MLARLNPNLSQQTFFSSRHCWTGPRESKTFHPSDIVAILASKPKLESEANRYIDLEDHLSGAGIGATLAEKTSKQFASTRSTQNKYRLNYQVLLAYKFPQLREFAKLYREAETLLANRIESDINESAHILGLNATSPSSRQNLHYETLDASKHLINDTLKDQYVLRLEEIFGSRIELGKISEDELKHINKIASDIRSKQSSVLNYNFNKPTQRPKPEM